MARLQLSRRTVLRGVGGVAVALPALEAMAPPRAHAAAPKRFVLCYGGTSHGGGSRTNEVVPQAAGPDFALTRGLQPIGAFGLKKDVAVISGLKVPWQQGGAEVPPGGRPVNFHDHTMIPQVTGIRLTRKGASSTGPSADQIVADRLGAGVSQKSLMFRVQPVSYSGGTGGNRGRLSWGRGGAAMDPIVSPRLAYQSLFSQLPVSGSAPNPALELAAARRRSVLDLVRGETEKLLPKLAKGDQKRLQVHFDELRDLERRVTAIGGATGAAGCGRPMDPGADPPIGANHQIVNGILKAVSGAGYSDEERRAQLLCDMVAMAFTCDIARVASIMFTLTQCFMNQEPISGHKADVHGITHGEGGGGPAGIADGVAWHVKHFARLAARLRDTPDIDGRPILDSAALALVFEGGHGYDPEGGTAMSAHSTERMIVLVAGRAGGLRVGQHLVSQDRHPAQVLLTLMNAVGVPGGLGEVTGAIPGLL